MAERADAIIVGAGIMGVSTAYHLVRRRYGRVVVLERSTVCSGSTALASGGVRHQFSQRVSIELTQQSIAVFERFTEEFGVDPNFRQHGYLILWQTEEGLALCHQSVALTRSLGVDVRVLSPAEVADLCPYVQTADVRAASYTPRGGYADPYLFTTAIAARARDLGAVIKQEHEVIGFTQGEGRVVGVLTNAGAFEAPVVVIAAGAWTGLVGKLAGLDIPVFPRRRNRFMTAPFPLEKIPAQTPVITSPEQRFSLRRWGPAISLSYGRKEEPSTFNTDPAWDLAPAVAERAVQRVPVLADAGIVGASAGLYEMTPDQNGIISAVPGVAGLYVLAGFSGHGFMHGPIAGQLMAELIVDGRAHTVDVSVLSLERFSRGLTAFSKLSEWGL